MIGGKEYFLIMTEENYLSLTSEQRQSVKHTEVIEANEWLNNQDDEIYRKLYKAKRNASKELSEYLFNKRNNLKK